MWEKLTRGDLRQARQELDFRRQEITRRHAEEIAGVDADDAEVEALKRSINAFVEKFKTTPMSSST
jgi:uncharacterized protein involved in exopolysaccharide biosynthesis